MMFIFLFFKQKTAYEMRSSYWSSDVCSSDLADLAVIERCSGHGGSWCVMQENFETAIKVGRPVARQTANSGKKYLASECPLAGMHIAQGIEKLSEKADAAPEIEKVAHPIILFARAYGIATEAGRR